MNEQKAKELLAEIKIIQETIDHKKLEIHLLEQRQNKYKKELSEITNIKF